MTKFLNQSNLRQRVYLPSRTMRFDSDVTIEKGLSIKVYDERDVAYLRQLSGDGRPFREVPDDTPTRDFRSSRMSL